MKSKIFQNETTIIRVCVLALLLAFTLPATKVFYASNVSTQGIGEIIGGIIGGGAGGVVTDIVTSGIGDMLKNYISDTTLDGAVGWASNIYEEAVNSIIGFAFDGFRPDVATFNAYVAEDYFKIFPKIGYTMAILLYVVMLLFVVFGAIQWAEVKENPWQLTGRLLLSLFIIYNSELLVKTFFKIADVLWDVCMAQESGVFAVDITAQLINMAVPVSLIAGIGMNTTSVLGVMMIVIFGIVFLKFFFRFAMEVIERYIVACFLYYLCPLPAATIVSKNASAVCKKYMQMLIVQLLMLFMNLIFIKAVAMMIASSLTYTFTGFLFLLSFMKVAQRIDNYAFTMGLSVAVTGGSLLDAASGAGRNLLNMSRGLMTGSALAGNALIAKGASVGDLSMLKKGMDMKNMSRPYGMFGAKTSQGEAINAAARMGSATDIARNLSPKDIDQSMVEMARTGRNNAILNEMPLDTKQALFERAYGDDLLPDNASIKSISWNKQGDCVGELDVSQIGVNGEEGDHFTTAFKVSDQATNDAIASSTNEFDTPFYLTAKGSMQEGDSINVNPRDEASVTTAEMLSGMNFDSLGDMKDQIQSVSMEGDNSVVLRDTDGDILARMDKGRNGQTNIAFNDDAVLTEASIGKLSSMQHLHGLCLENNGDGTVALYGQNYSTGEIEKYSMYNKAIYTRNDVETATGSKVYAGFGNRNRTTGSWHVVKNTTRTKDAKEKVQTEYEFARAKANGRTHLDVPRYKQ